VIGGLATETLAEFVRHASTWLETRRLSSKPCSNDVLLGFLAPDHFFCLLVCYMPLARLDRARAVAAAASNTRVPGIPLDPSQCVQGCGLGCRCPRERV